MSFPDDTFDVAYSFAVFQHLQEPERVASEMARVVRPGGFVYLEFILYTSQTGSHDLRLLGGGTADIPGWAHLRAGYADTVQQSAYLNRLRLPQWRAIFAATLPGHELMLVSSEDPAVEAELRRLRETGELADYEPDELLTSKVVVMWQKPRINDAAPAVSP